MYKVNNYPLLYISLRISNIPIHFKHKNKLQLTNPNNFNEKNEKSITLKRLRSISKIT